MSRVLVLCSRCGAEFKPRVRVQLIDSTTEDGWADPIKEEVAVFDGWIPCACGAKTPHDDLVLGIEVEKPGPVPWTVLDARRPRGTVFVESTWSAEASVVLPCCQEVVHLEFDGEPREVVTWSGVPCPKCGTTYTIELSAENKT